MKGTSNKLLSGCVEVGVVLGVLLLFVVIGLAQLFAESKPANKPDAGQPGGPVQPGQPGGPAVPGPGALPVISQREFTSGTSSATVAGAFALDPGTTWEVGGDSDGRRAHIELWVGVAALPDPAMTLVIGAAGGEPYRIEIYTGDWVATHQGTGRDGCTWQVEVTESTVSGHVSCPAVPAENLDDGSTGTVSVKLDFTANS